MLLRLCREAGFQPKVAFESNDHQVQLGLVSSGVGVTLLPGLAFETAVDDVEVRPVEGPCPSREVLAAVPSEGYRSPATEAMIEVLKEVSEHFRSNVKLPTSLS
jgi:DNA-binding transcriptional LysR family regulator